MHLSKEDIDALNECEKNKNRVVVTGKNGFGQPFKTEGYIYNDEKNFTCRYGFSLFVGQGVNINKRQNKHFFVPLFSSTDYDIGHAGLYFEKVVLKRDGTEIVVNKDFNNIIKESVEFEKTYNLQEHDATSNKLGQELIKFIGKPIIYNNDSNRHRCVIVSVGLIKDVLCVNTTNGYMDRSFRNVHIEDVEIDKKAYEELDQYAISTTTNI